MLDEDLDVQYATKRHRCDAAQAAASAEHGSRVEVRGQPSIRADPLHIDETPLPVPIRDTGFSSIGRPLRCLRGECRARPGSKISSRSRTARARKPHMCPQRTSSPAQETTGRFGSNKLRSLLYCVRGRSEGRTTLSANVVKASSTSERSNRPPSRNHRAIENNESQMNCCAILASAS